MENKGEIKMGESKEVKQDVKKDIKPLPLTIEDNVAEIHVNKYVREEVTVLGVHKGDKNGK